MQAQRPQRPGRKHPGLKQLGVRKSKRPGQESQVLSEEKTLLHPRPSPTAGRVPSVSRDFKFSREAENPDLDLNIPISKYKRLTYIKKIKDPWASQNTSADWTRPWAQFITHLPAQPQPWDGRLVTMAAGRSPQTSFLCKLTRSLMPAAYISSSIPRLSAHPCSSSRSSKKTEHLGTPE